MKYKFLLSLLIFYINCSYGIKQISLNEMASSPILNLTSNGIIIKTANSKVDSAFLIYKIESEIDQSNKTIYLKGFQALGKEFKNEFLISLKKEIVENIQAYKIYWVDRDEKKNRLYIKGL